MPTRAEIQDTLASSQTEVLTFFQGLSPEDLERPATENDVPGATPWRAKDHLAHLAQNERNIQHLLRRGVLAGEPPDVFLRLQYPAEVPLPGILGDWDALTPEEQEQLNLAVARINQTYLNAHQDDTLEMLVAEFLAARQDTVDLLHQFSDEQLASAVPTIDGEGATGDFFAGHAGHAVEHITSIEEGSRCAATQTDPMPAGSLQVGSNVDAASVCPLLKRAGETVGPECRLQ